MSEEKKKTKEKIIVSYEVDAETGEILSEIYEGDRIVHQKDEDEKTIDGFNHGKKFVKLYAGVSQLRGKGKDKLSDKEFAVTIALSDFVCFEDCCLREGGHRNGKILTQAELATKLDMQYKNFNNTFRSLRKKMVLGTFHTGGEEYITVNPWIFTRGTRVNATVAAYFESSVWAKNIPLKMEKMG